jgi:RHH-type rel operon transcriptional repressor/antitoxin RelB
MEVREKMNKVNLSLRVSEELEKKLEKTAKKLDRNKSYLVRKALEKYLEEIEDYEIATERLSKKNAKYYETSEVKRLLNINEL